MTTPPPVPQPTPPGGHPRLALVGKLVTAVAVVVVLFDWFGVIDTLGAEDERERNDRVPAEHLYLDDERTDAYLGQIEGGLAPTETRTRKLTRGRHAKAGVKDAVELGGNITEEEGIESKVSLKAADRFYKLETRLAETFGGIEALKPFGSELRDLPSDELRELLVNNQTASGQRALEEGQFVRITGAKLAVPTYTLGLAKISHAQAFRSPVQRQRRRRVFRGALSQFATTNQEELAKYTKAIGADPRLPFRVMLGDPANRGPEPSTSERASIFLPSRYSKLADAPALLTGKLTIVGKVVRLAESDSDYFDVETAVAYQRALEEVTPGVRRVLAVPRKEIRKTVGASATVEGPALVVIPVAIYK